MQEDLHNKHEEDRPDLPRHPKRIIEAQITLGLKEHNRSPVGLFLSALAAGLEVGFSLLFLAIMYTSFHGHVSHGGMQLILGLSYTIGFVFVIIGRSELFTEHTTLAVLPVLNRKATILSLLIVWGVIYLGNLAGGYLIAGLQTFIGPRMGIIDFDTFGALAHHMTDHSWDVILVSAILAGWLMGLLSWLVTSARETISRILIVMLITTAIGLAGFHHSIVGSIEVFAGLITDPTITFSMYLKTQGLATLGNVIGGVVFVALLKYSQTFYGED